MHASTWLFRGETLEYAMARGGVQPREIDDGEIEDHAWIRPGDALARHAAGEIDIVPVLPPPLVALLLCPTSVNGLVTKLATSL